MVITVVLTKITGNIEIEIVIVNVVDHAPRVEVAPIEIGKKINHHLISKQELDQRQMRKPKLKTKMNNLNFQFLRI